MAERVVSVSRVIRAAPEEIFDLLADPKQHVRFDGSNTLQLARDDGPGRLALGSKFGMEMMLSLIRYGITNTVVEFDENRLIAWEHFGKHRWRYRLEPVVEGTKVTEEFDWSTSRFPLGIELARYPKRHPANMQRTLERLAKLVETP